MYYIIVQPDGMIEVQTPLAQSTPYSCWKETVIDNQIYHDLDNMEMSMAMIRMFLSTEVWPSKLLCTQNDVTSKKRYMQFAEVAFFHFRILT